MDSADLLRKARTTGQSMQREREYKRTLHPYGRSSCTVVFSSPDPSEIRGGVDIITSPLVHLHPNTLTETHGTSAVSLHTGVEVFDLKSARRDRLLWETGCEALWRTSKDDDDWCTGLVTWFDWVRAVKSLFIVTKINSTSTENNFASQPCRLSYSFGKRSLFLYGLIGLRF